MVCDFPISVFFVLFAQEEEEDVPAELKNTEEYQELLRLKQLRQRKLRDDDQHTGYKVLYLACSIKGASVFQYW